MLRYTKQAKCTFCFFGTNAFHVKAENEKLIAADLRCRQNLKHENLRRPLADYVKNCAKNRATRAARLFFLIQPIKSLICGVVVVVASSFLKLPICNQSASASRRLSIAVDVITKAQFSQLSVCVLFGPRFYLLIP